MILILRLLPFLASLLQAALFWYQAKQPSTYPWIVGVGWLAVPAAALAISWGRIALRDLLHKMMPTFVTLACLAFGLLLVEGVWQFWLLATLAAIISFISLELLFLLSYDPAAYPVNGISRVNVGYVPIAVWYAASTSTGLQTFLHLEPIWHIALMTVLGIVLFRATGHPDASKAQDRVWTLVGALVGLEVGLIGSLVPIGMQAQGLVAAVIFAAALRARRYLYQPKPPKSLAYAEMAAAFVVFVAALASTKWI